jgi:hypothetical protein
MSSKGTHLATIKTKELRANLARGDVDAQTVISDRAHRSLPDTPVDRRGAAVEVESRWTSCARLASSGLGRGAAFEFSLQSGTGL